MCSEVKIYNKNSNKNNEKSLLRVFAFGNYLSFFYFIILIPPVIEENKIKNISNAQTCSQSQKLKSSQVKVMT